ncbi:MAG: division/cell wall cluster transcriptional repressor MraZ [Peptostreptococcaceae bacterium]|nr:division/cell wall cluster transcriptional repressor MraZ [Peptostreptococcaceae bacterium]
MLMGKYQNSIDLKSRMIVPAKYREELGFKFVLTRGIDKCLYIYPASEWEQFMKKLSELPSSDSNVRAFIRHFYANAIETEIDKQGRIIIPQELREYANIEKDLVTVGLLNKIEIWSKEEWGKAENKTELESSDFAQKMAEYGI